jgi:hypothetical protein
LSKLQPGTTVSLWVFGYAQGKIKDNRCPVEEQPDPKKEPLKTIKRFREPSPWKPGELPGIMQELEELFPFNETPLVRAMVEAKKTDFADDFKGFKSLLVITDGMDNCFKYDAPLHARHNSSDIEEFLFKEFQASGVRPIVVGFKVPPSEEAELAKKLRGALEKLPLKGHYIPVEKAASLGPILEKYMKQEFRFEIERENGTSAAPDLLQAMPENGFSISKPEDNDRPIYLKRGTYYVRVQMQKPLRQRIEVDDGDYLRLKLTRNGMERVPLASDYPQRAQREVLGWVLTLPQNQLKPPENALEMMLTMDNLAIVADTLKQIKPGRLWLELKPQDVERPIGLRWGALSGYAAPAWDIGVGEWPTRPGAAEPARPLLRLWWNPAAREAGSAGTIQREANADITSFKDKELKIGADAADKIHVESVQVEPQDAPGVSGKVSALVVRLRYPLGKPAWVEVVGPAHDRVEHRFYSEAGKYTGVFWTVTETAAKDNLTALQVYSLEMLQKDRATLATELPADGAPGNRGRDPSVFEALKK